MQIERSLFHKMSKKKESKKLVLVLATSTLVTAARKKAYKNTKISENSANKKNRDEDLETNLV